MVIAYFFIGALVAAMAAKIAVAKILTATLLLTKKNKLVTFKYKFYGYGPTIFRKMKGSFLTKNEAFFSFYLPS